MALPILQVLGPYASDPSPRGLRFTLAFPAPRGALIDGLCGWWDAHFDDETTLRTGPEAPETVWAQCRFLLQQPLSGLEELGLFPWPSVERYGSAMIPFHCWPCTGIDISCRPKALSQARILRKRSHPRVRLSFSLSARLDRHIILGLRSRYRTGSGASWCCRPLESLLVARQGSQGCRVSGERVHLLRVNGLPGDQGLSRGIL